MKAINGNKCTSRNDADFFGDGTRIALVCRRTRGDALGETYETAISSTGYPWLYTFLHLFCSKNVYDSRVLLYFEVCFYHNYKAHRGKMRVCCVRAPYGWAGGTVPPKVPDTTAPRTALPAPRALRTPYSLLFDAEAFPLCCQPKRWEGRRLTSQGSARTIDTTTTVPNLTSGEVVNSMLVWLVKC